MSFTPTVQRPKQLAPSGPRAGFWQRFFADLLDSIILGISYAILSHWLQTAGDVLLFILSAAYFTYLEGGPRGQTIGKSAMHIRVAGLKDNEPIGYQRAFIRNLARIVSTVALYIGYLWMLWDPERQTWHDHIVGAVVTPVMP